MLACKRKLAGGDCCSTSVLMWSLSVSVVQHLHPVSASHQPGKAARDLDQQGSGDTRSS